MYDFRLFFPCTGKVAAQVETLLQVKILFFGCRVRNRFLGKLPGLINIPYAY